MFVASSIRTCLTRLLALAREYRTSRRKSRKDALPKSSYHMSQEYRLRLLRSLGNKGQSSGDSCPKACRNDCGGRPERVMVCIIFISLKVARHVVQRMSWNTPPSLKPYNRWRWVMCSEGMWCTTPRMKGFAVSKEDDLMRKTGSSSNDSEETPNKGAPHGNICTTYSYVGPKSAVYLVEKRWIVYSFRCSLSEKALYVRVPNQSSGPWVLPPLRRTNERERRRND